jgi:hypothetical protein
VDYLEVMDLLGFLNNIFLSKIFGYIGKIIRFDIFYGLKLKMNLGN